jgi:putative DNA primase/helicase
LKRKEGDVDKAFVEDLDSRMAKSELEELGWRNREDLDDVMRDLERLAHKDWHKAASLWDKYRPNDIDKPVFIDGDDIDAKRSPDAKREAANDDKVSASERGDTEAEFMTPASIRKRFLQAEDKFYYREDDNKLAFEDKGQRLATAHNDPDVIRSMVELAEAKGWTSIKVKGTEDFKREAWLQASLKGLEVQGFQPKDVDLAKLEDLRKETDRKSERGLNSIERSPERARSTEDRSDVAPVRAPAIDEQHHNLSKQQLAAIDALKGVMRGRGDSDKAVEMAASIAAERFQTSRVYTGKVLEHGEAPFEFAKDNKESYYVKLQTPQGERTVWGVDLPRAMAEGQVKVGDDVALAYQGKQPVTVKEPVKDEAGKVVGEREVVTHRNAWDMRRLEAIREEARERLEEAAGRAERQPLVKVYDRDAQRSEQRTQVVRQQERDTERARG